MCQPESGLRELLVISPDQQCRAGGDRKKSFYNLKSKPKHPEFERPDWNPDKLAEQGFFLRGNSEVVCTGCNYKNKLDSYTSFKTSHSPPSSDQFSWMGKFKDYMGTWATGLKPTAVCSAKYSSTPETPEKDHSIYTTHRKKKGSNFKCHYKDDQRETLFDLRTHYGKGHYGLPQYRIITKPNEPVQSNSTNNLALMTIVEDENYQPQFIDEGHLFYWGSKLSEPFKSFTEELERASRGKELALIKQLNSHFRQIINIIKPCPATGYSSDELEMLKELLKTIRNELNQNHVRDIITLS
ncbi:hypothetical protein [Endozoicomonas sp. Mp262]|uniref:hypothetical protein n=1 Tax=Endozoicomonas sp. Mp262 TaxID=2919499 RepID=UPI0021D89933